MGNCSPKLKPQPPIHLSGADADLLTLRLRLCLLLKSIPFVFTPTPAGSLPVIRLGHKTLKSDSVLKFVGAAAVATGSEVKVLIELQHRSVERHVAGMERWVREMVEEMGKEGGERRREVGDWYGRLVEVMLEHAQMEERFLFPLLERAQHSGVCRGAIEEHGRDLPMMNGIKEDMKTLVAMHAGDPFYQEALMNMYIRLKKFQEHCKKHFKEEEKLVPLIESAERRRRDEGEEPWSQSKWAGKLMSMMESTHSPRLFPFFLAGLHPSEAMQYIDIICTCSSHDDDPIEVQVVELLHSVVCWFDGTLPLSWIHHSLASDEE